MNRDWEQTFRDWSKPSSNTETEKCERAERMVRLAISNSRKLSQRNLSILTQGSYHNNTNVKEDSDVDIRVCCHDLIMTDYSFAPNLNNSLAGLIPSSYNYDQFKDEVGEALVEQFGILGVNRGNKAFDVHANTYRIDADVIPTMEYRLYNPNGTYHQGTYIITNDGKHIFNYPNQHYTNGITKNKQTNNRFKFITRAMKRLRNEMVENGNIYAKSIPSYLIECLIFNVPNNMLMSNLFKDAVKSSILYLWGMTEDFNKCKDWFEVNNIKYLFHSTQKWTFEEVNNFMVAAWHYIDSN